MQSSACVPGRSALAWSLVSLLTTSSCASDRNAATTGKLDRWIRSDRQLAMRDAPAALDLRDSRRIAERRRAGGRSDPVLRRHRGQMPLVFFAGFRRIGFALAVFEDGILAVERPTCVGPQHLHFRNVAAP